MGSSVAQAEHEEVAEACFVRWDVTEGRLPPDAVAQAAPAGPDGEAGRPGAGHERGAGGVQRSAEISRKLMVGRSVDACQGCGCGCACVR